MKHELERLARERWEAEEMGVEKFRKFERFRFFAHVNAVRLAGIALASDFTVRIESTIRPTCVQDVF